MSFSSEQVSLDAMPKRPSRPGSPATLEDHHLMIADNREGPIEVFVKVITSPLWGPIFLTYLGCRKAADLLVTPKTAEHIPSWMPANEIERAVYAALIVAGEPVNNC